MMQYEEVEEDIEKAINYVYRTKFYLRFMYKEDLFQEARMAIWQEMTKDNLDKEYFLKCLQKLAYRGMIKFVRERYHVGTKTGYLEEAMPENINWSSNDYTLNELLLLHDLTSVINHKIKHPSNIIEIISSLYSGYGFKEIGEKMNTHRANIHQKAIRFGNQLLKEWQPREAI